MSLDLLAVLFGGWAALTILILGILVGFAWADSSREYAEVVQAASGKGLGVSESAESLPGREYDLSILADALVRAHRRSGDQRLLSVLYPDRPLESKAVVVSLADHGRPFDWANPPEDVA